MICFLCWHRRIVVKKASSKKNTTRKDFKWLMFGNPNNFCRINLLITKMFQCTTSKNDMICCYAPTTKGWVFKNACGSLEGLSICMIVSIAAVSYYKVVERINKYLDKYYKIGKSFYLDINKTALKKMYIFKHESILFFYVETCTCPIGVDCTCTKNFNLF